MDSPLRRGLKRDKQHAVPGKWRSMLGLGFRSVLALCRGGIRVPGPPTGSFSLDGKDGCILICVDGYGIPHIKAKSRRDVYQGLGYMHGVDRLMQLDIGRSIATGSLSSRIGPLGLGVDRAARILGIASWAKRCVDHLQGDNRNILDSYCDGINCALAKRRHRHHGRLGRVWGAVAPFTPAHCLASGRIGGTDFGWFKVPALTMVAARLGRELAGDVFPSRRDLETFFDEGQYLSWTRRQERMQEEAPQSPGGSNAWAIAPHRTENGCAILAADPHLGSSAPGIFYLATLETGESTLHGMTIPAIPALVMGTNGTVAWGATNAMAVQSVLYREELLSDPADHYLCDGRPLPLQLREETIEVRFSRPERLTVRSTHRGPILSDCALFKAGRNTYSLAWSGLEMADDLDGFQRLSDARTVEDVEQAVSRLGCPGLNIVYATAAGNIGKITAGRFPVREGFDGSLVVDGTRSKTDIRGFVPPDRWPRVQDPGRGLVVSANEAPEQAADLPRFSLFHSPDHRARRIREILEALERHTRDSAVRPQTDLVSVYAIENTGRLLSAAAQAGLDEKARKGADVLRQWDGAFDPESAGAVVFHATFQALTTAVFLERLGPRLLKRFAQGYTIYSVMDRLLENPSSPLWGNGGMQESVARALSQAVGTLERLFGDSPEDWKWRWVLRIDLSSPFAMIPILKERKARIGLGEGRGTFTTPFQIMHTGKDLKEKANVGPSARLFVELSNPVRVEAILSSGQSEIPGSAHFSDMAEAYCRGELVPLGRKSSP